MSEHECCNEAIKVDISYIKDGIKSMKEQNAKDVDDLKLALGRKANKWVETFIYTGMLGTLAWAGKQLLDLIPKAYALFVN